MLEANKESGPKSFDRGEFYPKVKAWIVEKFGGEKYADFCKILPASISDRLENADQAAWYPVEDSRLLYEKLFSFFGEEHLPDYVRFYVDKAISGFIRGLVAFLKPLDLAKRSLALWKRFHSTGKPKIEMVSPTHGKITLADWNHSPIHCKVHTLWFTELARIAGAKDIEVTETHCVHRGDEFCRWDVTFNYQKPGHN